MRRLKLVAWALSPDGSTLDQLESKPIPHTESAWGPFFSPDGKWVGFFNWEEQTLKKVSLMGGTPQTLCEVAIPRGGSWGQDGTIVFGQRPGLWRVSDAGGTPEETTGVQWGFLPQILPGGKVVVFSRYGKVPSIVVLSLETGEEKVLFEPGFYPRYAATGHLIYALKEELWAAPFDLETLKVTGDSTPVLEGLWTTSGGGAVQHLGERNTGLYSRTGKQWEHTALGRSPGRATTSDGNPPELQFRSFFA